MATSGHDNCTSPEPARNGGAAVKLFATEEFPLLHQQPKDAIRANAKNEPHASSAPATPHLVLIGDHTRPCVIRKELIATLCPAWNITTCTVVDRIYQFPLIELPAVVLIDSSVPAGFAVQHACELSKALPDVPLLALLRAVEASAILILLKAGATGCVIEPFSPSELRACITEEVQGGSTVLCRRARALLLENFVPSQCTANRAMITRREKDVIQWLSSNLTYKQIAERLGIAPETVHRHAANLYKKYDAHSRDEVVRRHFGLSL